MAHNLKRARMLHDWTQDQAAERLEPYLGERWSRVVFSAAERSVRGERIRHFTADDLIAFSAAFELPVAYFLMPPTSRNPDAKYVPQHIAAPNARKTLTPEAMAELVTSSPDDRVAELVEKRLESMMGPDYRAQLRAHDERIQREADEGRELQEEAGRRALADAPRRRAAQKKGSKR